MVQVVTVSANTAAFAAEPLRASARVSGSSPSEQTVKALAAEARKSGDLQQRALLNVVQPPALALFFLTADQNRPQTTLEMARQEYLLHAGDNSPPSEDEPDAPDVLSDDRVDPA
ncbi:MAG: hypothetical protein JWL86_3715 [Rhizobium sp.]|nr:hypothetical protein [Rhizobium sp.]